MIWTESDSVLEAWVVAGFDWSDMVNKGGVGGISPSLFVFPERVGDQIPALIPY